jgi:hypothetical protein
MNARRLLHVVALAAWAIPSSAATADQDSRLVGAHEIPRFVLERIELPSGMLADRPQATEGSGPSRPAHGQGKGAQLSNGLTGDGAEEAAIREWHASPSPD